MKLRVAAVQMEHKGGDINYNLKVIGNFVKQASKDKADVISFPECCTVGYMFLAKLPLEEIQKLAQPLDGFIVKQLVEYAKMNNIIIAAGMLEKDIEENIFNTYVTVGPKGLINSFRKMHPFINTAIKPGNEYKIYDLLGWKASTLICYDIASIPENSRAVSLLGAEIIFAPHQAGGFDYPNAGMGIIAQDLWINREKNPDALKKEFLGSKGREWLMKWLPSRAYDNALYIVYTNGVGLDGPKEVRTGNACILDPTGIILAESFALGDDMVIADCDINEIKKALGTVCKQSRRPSLYKILCKGEDGKTQPVWKAFKKL